jgi:nucleotidyltransferase substrate binding protein (TIGR01987 family)
VNNVRLDTAFVTAEKAIKALKVALDKPMEEDLTNVDATIQRFEFSIELFWKFLKRILASKGIVVQYPKDVLREAYAGGLIDNESLWLSMLHDRNLSSHTYNQDLALEIYARIKTYYPVLALTTQNLKKRIEKQEQH